MNAQLPDATALHPRLQALVQELTDARRELLEAAHEVPAAQRMLRPSPDQWSVTEVLDHLVKVESSSGRLFSVHSRQLRANGAPPETETEIASIVAPYARFGMETRARRVDAPEMVSPSADVDFDAAVTALETSRARLLLALREADGLALGSVSVPHPRLGALTLYEWVLTIARHERRHVLQLHDIRDALLSSPSA